MGIHKFLIERNDSVQKSTDLLTKEVEWDRIVWTNDNDCEYNLYGILDGHRVYDGTDSFFASHPMKVSIIKLTPSYYIFRAIMDSGNKAVIYFDTVQRIKG